MPIYRYSCNQCGTEFEVARIRVGEAEQRLYCPNCDIEQPVTRVVALCNFKLGWVTTPYTPAGSRQTKVKDIGGQFYDQESYNAKRLSKITGRNIRTADYRRMKRQGNLPKNFKEVE